MGTRLERVVIRGFRSIREIDLALRPINVLIGANGAGKSNFLAFFRLMQQLARGELQRYVVDQGGLDKILHFGQKRTKGMYASAQFGADLYQASFTTNNAGQLILAESVRTLSEPGTDLSLDLVISGTESRLRNHPDPAFKRVLARIEAWRVYHFHDTTPSAAVKQPTGVGNNVALTSDAGNIAAFLRRIADTPAYRLIVLTVQRIAPFFRDFVLEPEDSAGRHVRLRWSHVGSDDVFDANDFSDGTLRFICLATVLLQPEPPALIILDEPELGLHPLALGILAGLVRALPDSTQVVLATQSVTLVNQFDVEDIVIAERSEQSSTLRRLKASELEGWLDEYGVGDLWEKNVFGARPR